MPSNTGTYMEPSRGIPISHDVDVVVAGGGTAGVTAAVCAARLGLSVVMIEQSAIPGGMVTHVTQWLGKYVTKGGFPLEFIKAIQTRGICEFPYYRGAEVIPYFDEILSDAGVIPLYLAMAVTPILEKHRLTGVIVESKSGRHAVLAKVVIDATGDGDVAVRAGAKFHIGRDTDGACQAISLSHLVMNYTGQDMDGKAFLELIDRAARRAGNNYKLPYDRINRFRKLPGSRQAYLNGTPHVTGYDALDAESLSQAMVALRRQAVEFYRTIKNHTEEFRDIEFGPFSAIPGVRETRRIVCDETITHDDAIQGTRRKDGLFLVTQNIDIHKCTENEPSIVLEKVKPYHVPYGALLPKGLENLLVVGRCIGGEHESMASYRVIPDCMAMGEAAAVAAKMAISENTTVREVPAADIIAELHSRGYQAG